MASTRSQWQSKGPSSVYKYMHMEMHLITRSRAVQNLHVCVQSWKTKSESHLLTAYWTKRTVSEKLVFNYIVIGIYVIY